MFVKTKKVFLSLFLSIFLIISTASGVYSYSSILAFGDSLSDNGYYQGYPGGAVGNTNPADVYGFRRYSNGPVWVEYLSQSIGIPLLDMAYGGATSSFDNPAAYAALGDPKYLSQTGLQWQVAVYSGSVSVISPDALVTVWAGGNDMFNGRSPLTAAQNIALAIQNLIALGGHSFIVPNLAIGGAYATWMTAFDAALASQLSNLMQLYANVDFFGLDMNALVFTGIDHVTGTWKANSCENNPNDPNCENGVFLSWDGVHPTTEVHQQIAAYAFQAAVPEPASIILLIIGLAGLVSIRKRI